MSFKRVAAPALNRGTPAFLCAARSGDDIDHASNGVRSIERGLLAAKYFDFDNVFIAKAAKIKSAIRWVSDFNTVNNDANMIGL